MPADKESRNGKPQLECGQKVPAMGRGTRGQWNGGMMGCSLSWLIAKFPDGPESVSSEHTSCSEVLDRFRNFRWELTVHLVFVVIW